MHNKSTLVCKNIVYVMGRGGYSNEMTTDTVTYRVNKLELETHKYIGT